MSDEPTGVIAQVAAIVLVSFMWGLILWAAWIAAGWWIW